MGSSMELWDYYKSSVFLCHQPLGNAIDFAIISAQNPAGNLVPAAHNRLLDCQFEQQLRLSKLPYRSLIGASPDFSFQEKSWAVLCNKAQALAFAHQLQQNAIYWVEQGALYLVPALLPTDEEYLGLFHERQIVVD